MLSHQHILLHGVRKNFPVLESRGKQVPIRLHLIFPDINAVHQNPPLSRVIKPHQQFHQRAFSRAVIPRQSHTLISFYLKMNVLQHITVLFVTEGHMLKLHRADGKLRHQPFLILRDGGHILQKVPRLLDIQSVFHDNHHRIYKFVQNPCIFVHNRQNDRHFRKNHRPGDRYAVAGVENRPLLRQQKDKILEHAEKNDISQRVPGNHLLYGSDNPIVLLFQQAKNVCHPNFLRVLAKVKRPVHIVRHSLKNDVLLFHTEDSAV